MPMENGVFTLACNGILFKMYMITGTDVGKWIDSGEMSFDCFCVLTKVGIQITLGK